MPNSAKNTSVMRQLAAEKRGFSKKRMSSIGSTPCAPTRRTRPARTRADAERGEDRRSTPSRGRGLDDRPQQRDQADDREHGADRVEPRRVTGRATRGRADARRRARRSTIGHVDEEHRAPPEVLEQRSRRRSGRSRCRAPATPAQMPIASAALVRSGNDVGEDRQRRRHDERAADAHQRPGRRSAGRRGRRAPTAAEPTPKTTRPMVSARCAAEAVAEAARR